MLGFLYGLVAWAASGLVARLLVGAGLTVVVYAGFDVAVQGLLDDVVLSMQSLPADILALALLSGIGQALGVLGSALLARVALTFAGNLAGLRKN